MCGIAGIAFADAGRLPDPEVVARMTDIVRHRGPDGVGLYTGAGVGLGVRRLAIVDPEGGQQPVASEDGSIVLVCNGEIYNFVELRQELESRGHRFATGSDVEVIVHLYEEQGPACVHRLRGMFAFALWDLPRRRLMLARDRIGIKPLHYAFDGHALYFGSEQKSILVGSSIDREIDAVAIQDLFSLGFVRGPRTLFHRIRSLPPAHYLLYTQREPSLCRYWYIRFPAVGEPSPRRSAAEWAEALRAKLTECVRLHLRSDVALGTWLSGGLDSSAVTALMSGLLNQPIRSFSLSFTLPQFDEFGHQKTLDRYPEFRLSGERAVCGDDALGWMPAALWHLETPSLTGMPVLRMILSELSARGVKVVLAGEGADEVLGGYRWYRTQKMLAALRWLPRSVHTLARLPPIRRRWRRAADLIADPPGTGMAGYARLLSSGTKERPLSIWSSDLGGRIAATPDDIEAWRPDEFASWHPFAQLQWHDLTVRLPDMILSDVDRASMAYGVEVRVPFLDHELLELCASIPPRLKMRGLREKYVLRRAMAGALPREIAWRPKRGLRAPREQWFRGDLPPFARDLLDVRAIREKNYFDPEAVHSQLEASPGRRRDRLLMGVLSVHLWDDLLRSGVVNTTPSTGR